MAAPQISDPKEQAAKLLDDYQRELREKYVTLNLASWKASNSGKAEDFAAKAQAELAYKQFHSDSARYRAIMALKPYHTELDPLTVRALQVAELEHTENQLPPEQLKKLVDKSALIEQTFNTFRGEFEGKKLSNNELLDLLEKETSSLRRQAIWQALKQVGNAVAPHLIELAKLRNEAALKLGFKNYWEMRIRIQEHDPYRIVKLFAELDKSTDQPFTRMKKQLDREVAARLKIKADEVQAWHYDNPFFQAPPPSAAVNPDDFYASKKKEEIVAMAQAFYSDLGIPIESVVAVSDLYEREGKDQHAFCTDIDRNGDVRTLQNVRAKSDSMDTMLHEMGHAVYSKNIDRSLPFNIRDNAHIFTTEAIAMMFGSQAYNPDWLIKYAGSEPKKARKAGKALAEQRRREQLIFARWTLVMLNFEKALYENPDQDLNTLWWTMVNRFQKVPRPQDRNSADWAAKPHFTIAPVYYHNYMMGELLAAQLRHVKTKLPAAGGDKAFGEWLKTKMFQPGMRWQWPRFIQEATGEELTAKYFARELK